MKLPNGEFAIIEDEKILNYLLDPLHREGRHHAELFQRLLGIDRNSWTTLQKALRTAARDGARLERQSDVKLSTLRDWAVATGGELFLAVRRSGKLSQFVG